MSVIQYNELINAPSAARLLAYAPYSGFQAGKTYTGCNVEDVSLGLTICAERSAMATKSLLARAITVAIAVVTAGKKPAIPCGACRQVLAEFDPSIKVLAATVDAGGQEFELAELLLPFPAQGILEGSRDV